MLSRFENSQIGERIIGESKSSFHSIMETHFKRYAFSYIEKKKADYDVDKIITKKIMLHLQTFFKQNSKDNHVRSKFTARKNIQYKNKTCKK